MANVTFSVSQSSYDLSYQNFVPAGKDFSLSAGGPEAAVLWTPTDDNLTGFVNEFANDNSAAGAYSDLANFSLRNVDLGIDRFALNLDISSAFFEAHVGTSITFEIVANAINSAGMPDAQGLEDITLNLLPDNPQNPFNSPQSIQNDYFGITRLQLSSDQVATENQAIVDNTTTERIFVDGLLSQVQNTTIPAVAVEGSMYGAVGTSDEITQLATVFLPPQVQNAIQNGLNPQVYACEALGLVFAFGNENGATTFDTTFGPSNPTTRATPAGDEAFATLAATAIFASDANANTPGAILQFVSNWEAFYTAHGVPGISNATVQQIDLAARGAAWGDAVGVALANHLGPLPDQVINFLEDAAQNGALYSKSLASQPAHVPFQGGIPEFGTSSASVEPVGLAAPDHLMI
jgi:hypothetical protein